MTTNGPETIARSDFLPEESFKSWGNYVNAFKQIPSRFKDRIGARSLDQTELFAVKAQSQHEMKKTLNWWDLIWFGLGAVVGSGIFVLTGIEAKQVAGPAVVLSFLVAGFSALLAVFCYTEFAVEIPVAGGSFAYLRVELGDFVAFLAAGNILLEYVIGNAAIARSWTSYLATLFNHHPDDFRITAHGISSDFSHLDPIAIAILISICILSVISIKGSSRFNFIASILHLAILIFIIVAGLAKANPNNLTPFAPFGFRGIFDASTVLFYSYLGFDAISTLAEETKNPAKDIPIGLIGSMLVATLIYCLMALTLCLMQPYNQIDPDAPFSFAFQAVGWGWAKYLVAAGALKGMTTVLLAGVVGQGRYVTHIARTHMIPPWFAHISKSGSPVHATLGMLIPTAVVAFFTNLEVLSNLLSISTLLIFSLVALAILVRRYYASGVTTKETLHKFIACLVLIISSAIAAAANWAAMAGWIGYPIIGLVWLLGTGGILVLVPQVKQPKVWGVPLVPFLPSLSIFVNIFLLGSIDKASFERFGIWTGCLLTYYVFFGLHASYDTAKENLTVIGDKELKSVEEGEVGNALQNQTN